MATDTSPRCSFCHKSGEMVGKLISSPSDYPRAYICGQCVVICGSILEDDKPAGDPRRADLLLHDPRLPELLSAVERWIKREQAGRDAAQELNLIREIASSMMQLEH